jgi:hypothetical protein
VLRVHLTQMTAPPADKRDLNRSGTHSERGKPVALLLGNAQQEGEPRGKLMGLLVWEDGKSERRPVIGRIGAES